LIRGFDDELVQRHHRGHAFVLEAPFSGRMNAAAAGRTFLCPRAADVDLVV
jgi:hypothetical protein